MDQKYQEQITSKCEPKVVKKFALGTYKSMHSLCHIDIANKGEPEDVNM